MTNTGDKPRIRTMIVDDSVVFRSVLRAALGEIPAVEIKFIAANGKQALDKLATSPVDLIIMDLEMPEMDGLQTLAALKTRNDKSRKLIFAAPTSSRYQSIASALAAGADDMIAKPAGLEGQGIEKAIELVRSELQPRIEALFAASRGSAQATEVAIKSLHQPAAAPSNQPPRRLLSSVHPKAIVIGSSTGGPMALRKIFATLRAPIALPIFIVQHMPPPFTKGLAAEIADLTGIDCREAEDGEVVQGGRIYVAPADFHTSLMFMQDRRQILLQVKSGEKINFVRPAVDPLFISAAKIYGKMLVGFVLTGMGSDGKLGACAIRDAGGAMIIQDQASSVVWGMAAQSTPRRAFDDMGDLTHCGTCLTRLAKAS